ncbi:MAG: class I SAM-dependent methyltransferase [bacterium]
MTEPQAGDSPAPLVRFDITTTHVEIRGEQFSIVHPKDAETLIDEAAFRRDERLPYWADVWPASVALARAVRAMDGAEKTLLELGCGVGLVATAALRAGFDVTATDYYEDALAFARLNCAAHSDHSLKTTILDWRHLPDAIQAFDVVAAADVLYERAYGPVVARTIATTLTEGGRALIADPGRVGSPAFFDALHNVGLRHVGASVVKVPLNGRDHSITVHEVGHQVA